MWVSNAWIREVREYLANGRSLNVQQNETHWKKMALLCTFAASLWLHANSLRAPLHVTLLRALSQVPRRPLRLALFEPLRVQV